MDHCTISNGYLTAIVKELGAELCSLTNAEGLQLIWDGGPAWPRHAPILFPIVGRLKNDELRHHGRTYSMKQHGFARDHRFTWCDTQSQSCTLSLSDNEETRARYPFAFRLDVIFTVDSKQLVIAYELTNTGKETLPASIGAHPAFNWPLVKGAAKHAHTIVFAEEERAQIRRVDGGLLGAGSYDSGIQDKTLTLNEALFAEDAMIMDNVASKSLRYSIPQGPGIDFSWDGFRQLGLWSKADGAPFLCIEPWYGYASPADFDGEFETKPGLMHLAPGEKRTFTQRITVD